jgi:putative oxidoreductase
MKLRPLLDKFETLASWLQSPLLFVIRFYWGLAFAQDGWGKLTHLAKIVDYFTELGIPLPQLNAIMASSTQCVCGSLLLVGLFSRVAAVPLVGVMLVAYATAEREALMAIFSDTDKFVTATPFLFLLASLIVLAFGPGKLSLDYLLLRRKTGA